MSARKLVLTLSKNEVEYCPDGKWRYKVLKREEFGRDGLPGRRPDYWDRLLELRERGLTYNACADTLNAEGYRSTRGKKAGLIRATTLINLAHYYRNGTLGRRA